MGCGKMKGRRMDTAMVEEYCAWLRENEKSPGTIERYRRFLLNFTLFSDGRTVCRQTAAQWKERIRQIMAPVTVNGAVAAVNGFFRYKGWGDCVMKFFRIGRRIFCPEQKELEREEYERMVRRAREEGDLRTALVMETIASTGIRVSELKYITVEALNQGAVNVECKGRIRTILCTEELKKKLLSYTERQGIGAGPVFVTRSGAPLDRSNIWRSMKRIGALAGVAAEKIFPHNLRHLFARIYYSQEKDLSRLADILGHSSVNTTRIYVMESGKNHLKQLEKMDMLVDDDGIPLLL